jgi:hypothetical protein
LTGKLALSDSPTTLGFDMAWAEGGVQQVWGLGVPLWRLPFELFARLCGGSAFPDRIALAIAVAITTYIVLRTFSAPIPTRDISEWLRRFSENPSRILIVVILPLFPPIVAICNGPFKVYEEPIVYGYYYSTVLFACTYSFAQRARVNLYLGLSLFAGLSGFVRPTLLAYGAATLCVTWLYACRAKWSWWKTLLGPAIFCFGGLLLFATNWKRFGSGFEFGHRLNMTSQDMMHFSRFGAPFDTEPLYSAVLEIVGALFMVNRLNSSEEVYHQGLVVWQSHTPRWRHLYHTTFDVSYLLSILSCWSCAAYRSLRLGRGQSVLRDVDLMVPAVWSLISLFLLVTFYGHYFALASRYMIDFAPGIGVGIVGCLLEFGKWRPTRGASRIVYGLFLSAAAIWWAYEVSTQEHDPFFPAATVVSKTQALEFSNIAPRAVALPSHYAARERTPRGNILVNLMGWNQVSGETESVVVLFVKDLRKLRLEVAAVNNEYLAYEQYRAILAKVGLEFLELESCDRTNAGYLLTF